jgi:hypothetical protein
LSSFRSRSRGRMNARVIGRKDVSRSRCPLVSSPADPGGCRPRGTPITSSEAGTIYSESESENENENQKKVDR